MRVVDLIGNGGDPLPLRLKPLTGADELALAGIGTAAAMTLLARLSEGPELSDLSVSQIDRALAAVYHMLYGTRADCRAVCADCGEAYEFALDLSEIIAAQDAERPGPPDREGAWALPDGRRLRAPRPADLAGGPEVLVARVMLEGDPQADPEAVGAFLERAAPVLTLDLDTACPHCGAAVPVRFDIAAYLTRRLAGERPFLIRETHLIASRYGWSHGEIMALTREDRRAFAGLIEGERARLQRRWSA